MNFTREPIIETIITPREGYRLAVRSTKHEGGQEFTVDAVEVVSFGSALFYRSLERPRPFLVPVGDYQVVEGKESRVVLKNASLDRTIKIGGGRSASFKKESEEESEEQTSPALLEEEPVDETYPSDTKPEVRLDYKRDRRRGSRRRHKDEQRPRGQASEGGEKTESPAAPPVPHFTHLIPPPTTLISASIQKYKDQQSQHSPPPQLPEAAPQQEGEGDANSISRERLDSSFFTPELPNMKDWNNF